MFHKINDTLVRGDYLARAVNNQGSFTLSVRWQRYPATVHTPLGPLTFTNLGRVLPAHDLGRWRFRGHIERMWPVAVATGCFA